MMKNGVYFIVIAFLVAKLFKILFYANQRTCDVTGLTQNDVKSQIWNAFANTQSTGLKFCRVDVMRELHIEIRCCHSNILIPRPLHKLKNALFVAPESDRLSFACVTCTCSDLLNEHQELITLLKRRGILTLPFGWKGPGAHCVSMEMSQRKCHKGHAMELCDEYTNCTKFQFYP